MAASQILSVLSWLPLSTLAPSGEKEQELTQLECPLRVRFTPPVPKGGRSLVSDSRAQFMHTSNRHGSTNAAIGTRLCLNHKT